MGKLIFEDTGEEAELPEGERIQEACEEAGIPFACTEGICGTCCIEVTEGMENLSDYTEAEQDFLGDLDFERLACQCQIKNGTVRIKF
ncbi:MAG: 2Fe-2S iron-sulfur cluster-binding protein [Parachlamydiales bacterium]